MGEQGNAIELFLTLEEVAKIAGISPRKVSLWVSRNWLPKPINPDARRDYRWNPEAVRRWKLNKAG